MNNKVTINPQLIAKYDFKHLFSYKLIYHIMIYYDTELHRVRLNVSELINQYNGNNKTIKSAIEELVDNNIIIKSDIYSNWYNINTKVFIKFVNGVTK